MFLASFVVAEEFSLEDVFEKFACNDAHAGFVRRRAADGQFERIVSSASVAIREGGDAEEDIVGSVDRFISKTVFFVVQGAAEKLGDLWGGEGIEDVDFCAGEQRGNNLEGRILGGRGVIKKKTGFDVREKGILLRYIEAVNFVAEDDGAMAVAGVVLCDGHDFLDFLDA